MAKKLATVLGATGNQGTAVITALLQNGNYRIRALTRRPDSDAATALKAKGFEIVQVDTNDEASLRAAFTGSHLIFAVTDFSEQFRRPDVDASKAQALEFQQGRNIVHAVRATPTVEHFIWSTLPHSAKISGGKALVPHFDGKAEVDALIRADAALLARTTFLYIGWYAENFGKAIYHPILLPTPTPGLYTILADSAADVPLVTIGDVQRNLAPFVQAIIGQPDRTRNGAVVLAAFETVGFEALLQRWAGLHGKTAVYTRTDHETYIRLWGKWGEEMSAMERYFDEYRDRAWSYPGHEVLGAKELGIDPGEFVSLNETLLASTSWL